MSNQLLLHTADIVFIYQRMLPYHCARFEALSDAFFALGKGCIALEVSSGDSSYGDLGSDTPSRKHLAAYKKICLFEGADYLRCIEPYRQLFADESIRVVFNEDLNVDAESEVVSVLSFIGCDTDVSMVKFERMNTSDGKFYDGKIASIFRKSEIVTRLAQSLPDSLKSISKNILTNKKPPDIVWDEAIKKLVIDRLQQNSRTFLKQHGKPEEFWSFK